MSTPVTHRTLTGIADSIRRGEISAAEVTEACLARIEALGPRLNCFISLDAEGAREQARSADEALERGVAPGPLHGVPLAHKDMFYREGHVTTCGSRIRESFRPAYTATVIRRLEAAGALHLGGLNMAEFAFSPSGHNTHYGAARNPWSPDHITGGSSSGSGSATAARLVFGALGSDTGGSIRLPSAACGLVGMKPTQTRVSRHGVMGLSFSLDNVGPLTRTVRDCARMLAVIAGHDPLDPTSSTEPVPDYEAATRSARVEGLRVGVPDSYFNDTLEPAIGDRMEESLAALESLGAVRVPITLPDLDDLSALANVIQGSEAATLHAAWLRERPGDYGPQVRARIELGFGYAATEYLRAIQVRPRIVAGFVDTVFSRCDVLHVPGIPVELPTVEASDMEDAQGFAELLAGLSRCTRPFNYLGLPVLSVPAGFGPRGLPVGFQLAGRPYSEALLFRAGAAYEAATGWTDRAPELAPAAS